MVRTEFGLEYLQRPTNERLGLLILALGMKQTGEVAVISCNVGMILAENLFMDLDGPTKERLGLLILALGLKQNGEVIVAVRNVGMIVAEDLFADLDGPTIERLRLGIPSLGLKPKGGGVLSSPHARRSPSPKPFPP